LTSGSVHANVLPTVVLIAQAVFLLQRGQTDRKTQTRLNALPHADGYTAGVGKYAVSKDRTAY